MNKMFSSLAGKASRTLGRAKLAFIKNKPTIYFVGGCVGVISGTVLACKATRKLDDELVEIKDDLDKIHEANEHGATAIGENYTEKDYQNDLVKTYTKAAIKVAKLYAIPATLEIGGLVLFGRAHAELSARNAELAATCASLQTILKEVEERAKKEVGEEKAEKIIKTVTEELDDDGVARKTAEDPAGWSVYARYFDPNTSSEWDSSADYRDQLYTSTTTWANLELAKNGYLFLNDVYRHLGLKTTRTGQFHGWIFDPNNVCKIEINDYLLNSLIDDPYCRRYEKTVILDFNCDGFILNKVYPNEKKLLH